MERIHAFKSDGSLIKDIKVFQEAYKLIGLAWLGFMLQQNCLFWKNL
ncbi:hypothetical protein [Prochlorococcus marinus]|nr:hypothetical protein [Prochlorococcus marinus]